MNHAKLRYKSSCILAEYSPEYFRVKAGNYELEIRPRVISLRGCEHISVSTLYRGRKKAIYVKHRVIQSYQVDECRVGLEDELNVGYFTVKVTETSHGSYLTILTPGSFLSDYIVVGEDITYIQLPGGREAYFEKLGDLCTIYVV